MATIKERLAALNLAEKLYVRPPALGVICRNYQSFSSWSGLIAHLKASVHVKRRRVHFKSHGDCFLGSDAVDVVADHLSHVRGLQGAIVSRDKVVCVCQALLDCKVFEAVGTKACGKDKNHVFQDCKNALYRFRTHTPSVDELERGVLSQGIQKFFCTDASDGQEELRPLCSAAAMLCSPVKSMETQLENLSSASLSLAIVDTDTLSPSRLQTDAVLPHTLVNEVWQEQTTLRLLKLVDLPLLDGVLQCSLNQHPHTSGPNPLAPSNPDLIYSDHHLDRRLLQAFRDSNEDEWLCAALDCLALLPDQPVVELSREIPNCFPQEAECPEYMVADSLSPQEGKCPFTVHSGRYLVLFLAPIHLAAMLLNLRCDDNSCAFSPGGLGQCKLLVYEILVKHYTHTDRPQLLPEHLTDVYTAIIDLLVNAKLDKALEALQLCLKLLPPSCREELRRLLTFMSLAADPQGIRLDKEMENRLAVKRSFSRAIVHSKALSKEQEELMVVFMLSNRQEIFRIPGALHKAVSDKLANIVHGKPPDVTGSTFCQQVYRGSAHSKENTHRELRALAEQHTPGPQDLAQEEEGFAPAVLPGSPRGVRAVFWRLCP
ncbi:DEP domain-containing protein 7 [Merluccius polli]|uniref:DEP domain-containing protein 7 n=1 Tax=Merluccius polli TaxID=89951 RepID=A0AA47M2T4_MERPO|nr:DEP domain-containing protein 7 [Merluccius polli]